MKLNVIVDEDGNVIGTSQAGSIKIDNGTEVKLGVIAGPGQTIYELEVDDSILKENAFEIHKKLQDDQKLQDMLKAR